jgi:hypothetical protein
MKPPPHVYGLMAEYVDAQSVLEATRRAYQAGYRHMDAYAPYPVEGLPQALGLPRTRVPFVVLMGAIAGGCIGFFMQYWSMAVDYPFNSGGRPHNSWPAFIPITFEVLILVASFSALFSMIFLNGLPHPHHPVFSEPRFLRASQDRFFLCIEATDPRFDLESTLELLLSTPLHGEVMEIAFESEPAREEEEAADRQPSEVGV